MLALAVGCGSSTAATVASGQRHAGKGSVAGTVAFDGHKVTAVVTVVNAAHRRVARTSVRLGDNRFRFVLTPGRYEIEAELTRHYARRCTDAMAVRVRTNHTAYVLFSEEFLRGGCGDTY